jgi:hypothetical protein
MATTLQFCTKAEMKSIIRFFECRKNKTRLNLSKNILLFTWRNSIWLSSVSALKRHHFSPDEDVKTALYEWLQHRPQYFFRGIQPFALSWGRCVECNWDYTEDWYA